MADIWQRVAVGNHVLVLGELPPPGNVATIRVRVDRPGTLSPLDEACERLREALGESKPAWEHAIEDVSTIALRRRTLGETAMRSIELEFVSACNRLAGLSRGPVALVVEGLERADDATLTALEEILANPGWLRLPLVLQGSGATDSGGARGLDTLAGVMREHYGPDSVVEIGGSDRLDAAPEDAAFEVPGYPPEVLRVLRVGAVAGGTFEVALAAAVLDIPVAQVLEALQRALDLGVAVTDRGDGTVGLDPGLTASLGAGLLPSLRTYWHRRLANLVAPASAGPETALAGPSANLGAASLGATNLEETHLGAGRGGPTVPDAEIDDAELDAQSDYDPLFELDDASDVLAEPDLPRGTPPERAFVGSGDAREEPRPSARSSAGSPRSVVDDVSGAPTDVRADPGRAARHLSAAGELELAVERYLGAVGQLAARGDGRRALMLLAEAQEGAESIRGTPKGARLHARLLAAEGELRWRGVGTHASFTLASALDRLEEAKRELPASADVAESTRLSLAIAGVCFDLGDLRSLERALEELAGAARRLREAGDAVGAAALLNDQAAVYLRAGDPVRANALLRSSREAFRSMAPDPERKTLVEVELAETDHLLAKLPLQARLRSGQEGDAYSMALGHARAAEGAYRRLGRVRELARVWETMGRLELRRGNLERSAQRLHDAAGQQRRIGDHVGLARTAAALSDVYVAAERPREALALLAESIELNADNGSPAGIAFNRAAVGTLAAGLEALSTRESGMLSPAIDELRERLSQAERRLGAAPRP